MALQQINLRIEQELLKQMRAEAKQRGLSLNLLAASAFEQFLAGGGAAEQSAPKQDGLADVIRRLEVLEQKLAKQEQQAHHLPHGPAPTAVKPPAEAKPAAPVVQADGLLTPAFSSRVRHTPREKTGVEAKPAPPPQLGDGAISTADLATATNTNRAGWNNWARDKSPGDVRKMKGDVGSWRYLGKFPSELGGPDRGMWEPV